MMFRRLFRHRDADLRDLIGSFGADIAQGTVEDFLEYVEHRECGLAIEILSDWIYEHDIATSVDQQEAFVRVSERYGVDPSYHAFLGRQPPYPDLRPPQQLAEAELLHTPSLDTVRHLAHTGQKLLAVRMYREISGASLDQSIAAVDRMN